MTCQLCVDNYPREFFDGQWVHLLPSFGPRRPKSERTVACSFQEVSDRKGDWIQTWTGRQFFVLDPRPEDFHILDIAAGLRNARYSAQSISIETVAEHSVLMWLTARKRGLTPRLRRATLMHDLSEAYFVDMPRPVKPSVTNYIEIEDRIMRAGAARFDFDWPMPPEVKDLDNAILNDEFAQNMAPPPRPWRQLGGGPLGVPIQCWPPDLAMIRFLHAAAVEGVV